MIIYNLFIFFSVKDISHLFYILLIFFGMLTIMTLRGLAFQYVWPNWPWWNMQYIPFSLGIVTYLISSFGRLFTNAEKYYSRNNNRLSKTIIYLNLAAGFISLFLSYRISILLTTGILVATILYMLPS